MDGGGVGGGARTGSGQRHVHWRRLWREEHGHGRAPGLSSRQGNGSSGKAGADLHRGTHSRRPPPRELHLAEGGREEGWDHRCLAGRRHVQQRGVCGLQAGGVPGRGSSTGRDLQPAQHAATGGQRLYEHGALRAVPRARLSTGQLCGGVAYGRHRGETGDGPAGDSAEECAAGRRRECHGPSVAGDTGGGDAAEGCRDDRVGRPEGAGGGARHRAVRAWHGRRKQQRSRCRGGRREGSSREPDIRHGGRHPDGAAAHRGRGVGSVAGARQGGIGEHRPLCARLGDGRQPHDQRCRPRRVVGRATVEGRAGGHGGGPAGSASRGPGDRRRGGPRGGVAGAAGYAGGNRPAPRRAGRDSGRLGAVRGHG